jgi:hypothetical protein
MKLFIFVHKVLFMGRRSIIRKDLPCPSLRSSGGQVLQTVGKRYLGDCGKHFLGGAIYHHHPRWKVEQALRMYSNDMSMRSREFWRCR